MRPLRSIRRSFSVKLVLLLFSVAVLVGSIGGFIYFQTGQAVADDTDGTMTKATELQANTLETWVDQNHAQATSVATADPVVEDDGLAIASLLDDEAARAAPAVDGIHVVDAGTGEVLDSSMTGAVGESYADTLWMELDRELPAEGESTVTTTYEDPTTGQSAAAVVATVPGGDRLVVLPVDLVALSETVDQPTDTEGSFTHVVDADGQIVVSEHEDQLNTQNMGPEDELMVMSPGVEKGLEDEVGTVGPMEMHGEQIVMGHAPVEGADWVVMAHVPTDQAYALQTDVQWSVLILLLVSFLGLGLVGVVVGRNTAQSLGELADTAQEMEAGNLDVELESDREDEIGRLYGVFDSMRESLRDRIREARVARDEAEAERQRVEEINRELEGSADAYSEVMQEAAAGDLTVRMDPDADNDAMADIAAEFNDMVAEIERTVEELSAFAVQVATASEQVTASTEEVRSASQEISESVQEISVDAERQNDSLQSVTAEMADLSTTTEEIAASSDEVADIAERTAETGQAGRAAAEAAVGDMREVEEESSTAVSEMERLEEEVGQIDDLVERIQEIADQTNMLALNANIEASRSEGAGDDGGFGVVAEEVTELAQDVKAAAGEVEDRLEGIREQSRRSAEVVERTSDEVDAASQQVEAAVEALEEIAEYAAETNTGVQEISAATQQQAASTQEVVSQVDEAAAISEETTAEAENVAAATEEQTTALSEVSGAADDLSGQAARLSEALDRMDTDAGVADGTASGVPSGVAPGGDVARAGETGGSADGPDERAAADGFQPGVEPDDFGGERAVAPVATTGEAAGQSEGAGQSESAGESADGDLTALPGVGATKAAALRAAGFRTVEDLRAASHDDLAAVEGIGDSLAARIRREVHE